MYENTNLWSIVYLNSLHVMKVRLLFVIVGFPGTCVSVKSLSYVSMAVHSVNGPVPLTVIAAIFTWYNDFFSRLRSSKWRTFPGVVSTWTCFFCLRYRILYPVIWPFCSSGGGGCQRTVIDWMKQNIWNVTLFVQVFSCEISFEPWYLRLNLLTRV